jgi:outer membrane protein OmpA-like peptidoglycan-associated protein
MKRHSIFLAGTAIGLLMTAAPLAALPLSAGAAHEPPSTHLAEEHSSGASVILAQTEEEEEEERRRRAEEAEEDEQAGETPPASEEQDPPSEEPQAAEEPGPDPEAEDPATAEDEPAAEPETPTIAEEPPIEEPEDPAIAQEPADEPEQPAVAEEEPDTPAAAEDEAVEEQQDPATAEEPELEPDTPAAAEDETAEEPQDPATAEEPELEPDTPAAAEDETAEEPQDPATAEEPELEPAEEQPDEPAADTEEAEDDTGLPEDAAPVLDSAKEDPQAEDADEQQQAAEPTEEDRAPPESDAEAQAEITVNQEEIRSVVTEEGQRIERPQEARPIVREGAEVVREVNNRFIIQFNNNYYVERPREERFYVNASEVYYEELPRGRQREVVVRPDGTRIITIRNRYGDVVHRVKVLPDDREIILVYVEGRRFEDAREWHDPGADLPPLRLRIPVREYILDAERVDDPEDYYAFLHQPPVERVERTYSLTEVTRSARIRDKVRRIDLDVINFEFGSAGIAESEIPKLEGVAEAMQRLIEENPGETFLLEGHTDAVGSDMSNLALSDQRAESIAIALTNVFDIPPENLVTQGYGEQYLKIATEEPERENRRVAIRRITPLVAPVASAN